MRFVISISVLVVALPLLPAGCATTSTADRTAAFASPDAVILVKGMT